MNILFALALIGAYAANHISPARFWPIAFFGLAYPYLLLINLFFLAFWTWRRKKQAWLSVIVILAGFGNMGRYIQVNLSESPVAVDSVNLKLISYNVRIFNTYKWSGEAINRDSIITWINSEKPDIVCFQEFTTYTKVVGETEKYTNRLLEHTPYSHIRYTTASDRNKRKFGVATYSRYPIVRRGSIQFDHSYNSCIYSDVLFQDDTVRIYNLHLQSIHLNKNYTLLDSLAYPNAKRFDEVKDISGRVRDAFIRRAHQVDVVRRHIEASPYPVILCGDFNDTPVSYSYHQLLGEKEDAFRESGSGIGLTYRGKLPSFRIDYVFHDPTFIATHYATPGVSFSDHLPLVCVLKPVLP
ncbi:MAG: endonuclease/exonuclease/phosphatase family protein [Bacteroidota bacterium]|nr:MAG: endonuclease/exonuclease/phosphatase family protein [Bacteroidota bacterium]